MNAYKVEEIRFAGEAIDRPMRAVEVEQSLERLSWLLDDLFAFP